jgi:hypothetical protein
MTPAQPDLLFAPHAAEERPADAPGRLIQRWLALHDQAGQLARIADLAPEPQPDPDGLAAQLAAASAWQLALVEQGIEDIDALMQPGLTALRTITVRGRDATSPALALWREFHAARAAVLAVLDPATAAG